MHIILLTGAALVGVPILLHLIMRQEPKKLPFPAFRFLKLKRRINQRKMRLRHLLLLLLRMFLIALIALALFQPTLLSDRFNIKGERPIACVVLIDTSPSMGYVLSVDRGGLSDARKRGPVLLEEENTEDRKRPWTALDEARFRALELLDELPPGSKVAIIDTADRDSFWALSLADARKKIRALKKTVAASRTITQTLPLAYQLFGKGDLDAPGQENMPRLLAIFSDRTIPSWDPSQLPYLLEMKENVPKPAIMSSYIDVGVDKPLNLAITSIDMKPQIVPANQPVEFTVMLEATGSVQENTVQVHFDNEDSKLDVTRAVRVEPGVAKEITIRREAMAPGLHQAEISLKTPDALPTDDKRYLTFHVREPRKVLLVADAPLALGAIGGGLPMIGKVNSAVGVWRMALESKTWYAGDVATTQAFLELKPGQLAQYEAIVFAGLIVPGADVWDKATSYVEGGGKLIVLPGAKELRADGKDKPPPGYDHKLLPGALTTWIETDPFKTGVEWAWEALKDHRLLAEIKDWVKDPRYGLASRRPQAWGYWVVEPRDTLAVIASYADDPNADKRRPALLEKRIGQSGQVLLFTTPMDDRNNKEPNEPVYWNDYNRDSWFYLVLANHALRYLTGDTEDAEFNFKSGQTVEVKLPLDAAARSNLYYLSGPDLRDKDSELIRGEGETTFRLGPDRLKSAGNFAVLSDPSDKKPYLKPWREGFSLNAPADESNLERLPIESITALLGENSVVAADKERKIRDILGDKFSAPIELFPFLMILLLLFLAFENLLSNKFYRQPTQKLGE